MIILKLDNYNIDQKLKLRQIFAESFIKLSNKCSFEHDGECDDCSDKVICDDLTMAMLNIDSMIY